MNDFTELRVLVTGGRDYRDARAVAVSLARIDEECGISCVITGGATGADAPADAWAADTGKDRIVVTADWAKHGRAAGPIRNQLMLDVHNPDLVVAFPGGRGTADMVRRAKHAGIPVRFGASAVVPLRGESER